MPSKAVANYTFSSSDGRHQKFFVHKIAESGPSDIIVLTMPPITSIYFASN